jgi:hypothetical protein
MLTTTGFVGLTDSQGIVCLMVSADDPSNWPKYFGILTEFNPVNTANIDVSVVFIPPGGPPWVMLEAFTDLSLKATDSNYVKTQLNLLSRLISVPASYQPPAPGSLSALPTVPTTLTSAGTVSLLDTSNNAYLTLQATPPATWPPLFGVLAQGNQQTPGVFNLVVVYNPSSAGAGVNLPVTVELFNQVSFSTVSTQFSSGSALISVTSFDDEPNASLSAYDLMNFDASDAVPAITLTGTLNEVVTTWTPVQDLLEDSATTPHFVVEVEYTGAATLRFGDNINGRSPDTGTLFSASYRIGNGSSGNVGAESLVCLAAADARIQSCTNWLPAVGGTDPETNNQIRKRAPQAFLTQERAVIMSDYEAAAESNSQIDQAVATLRWTGSWYTVFIAAEPQGGGTLTPSLQKSIQQNVDLYRLAGHDVQVESPDYVSLEIALTVCVDSNYVRSNVKQSLLQVLGSGLLPNGQKGLFYPDSFTFGQTVYLSPMYAAARTVAGVVSVTATTFQPQGVDDGSGYLAAGEIKLGGFQVARLANDPSFPDRGQLTLNMEGGK